MTPYQALLVRELVDDWRSSPARPVDVITSDNDNDTEGSPMSRRLDPAGDGPAPVLSLRLPAATAAALRAETQRRSAAAGVPIPLTAVARALLESALERLGERL